MKKIRTLSVTCSVMIFLCLAAVLIGVVLGGQAVSGVSFPTSMPKSATSAPLLLTPITSQVRSTEFNPAAAVTAVIATPASSGVTVQIEVTPTPTPPLPAQPALGTLDYAITLTAEAQVAGTKVHAYLDGVDATRTAAAERVIPTHAALTAMAATRAGK